MKKEKEDTTAVAQKEDISQRMLALQADAAERQKQLEALGVDAQDLVIPLVQIMQGTSELVGDGKFKLGDIVNMQTVEKLGDFESKIKILPLKMYKTLRTYDVTNNGFKFMREEPWTPVTEKLQGEGTIENTPVKRYQTINLFALLKSDLDKNEAFPILIRFRSSGMNAGRAITTHLYKRVFLRQLPYSQFVELGAKREKKDTAAYGAWLVGLPETAPKEHQNVADQWLATLATASVKIDERGSDEGDEQTMNAAKPVVVEGEVVGGSAGPY